VRDGAEFTDQDAAAICASLSGRPADEWLPAIQAWTRAGMPVEDVWLGLALGNDPTPQRIEDLARDSAGYHLAELRDSWAEVRGDLAELRSETWLQIRELFRIRR